MAEQEEPIDQHAFLYRSRVWPLGGDCGPDTRGCIDGTRECQLENELRLWRTKERTEQHDWRLQPLMEAAAQNPNIKMEMEFAQPCKKHPFQAAWYWKSRCRHCARVYAAMPANLHRMRKKLHTPLLALDKDVDVLRRSASLVMEPRIQTPKPVATSIHERAWTPGPGAPKESPRVEPKPKIWVPQNVHYFGTEFTGLVTPSMLAPQMKGHWKSAPASAATGASQRSRSQAPRSQAGSLAGSRAASLPGSRAPGSRAASQPGSQPAGSRAAGSGAGGSRASRASALSATQTDRVSAAAREAVEVALLDVERDAPRFSRFAHAPGKPKTPPPISGMTAAGWAPVPAVGDPEKALF